MWNLFLFIIIIMYLIPTGACDFFTLLNSDLQVIAQLVLHCCNSDITQRPNFDSILTNILHCDLPERKFAVKSDEQRSLQYHVTNGNLVMLKKLALAGADFNDYGKCDVAPIWIASQLGLVEVITFSLFYFFSFCDDVGN